MPRANVTSRLAFAQIHLRPISLKCDDKNPKTGDDKCNGAGICKGRDMCKGSTKKCVAIGPCHHAGICQSGTGLCSNPKKQAGTACDDGNKNTVKDKCTATGLCIGTALEDKCKGKKPCEAKGQCFKAGTCQRG